MKHIIALLNFLVRRSLPLGTRGERLAARYLRRKGYIILGRNWRCKMGEIDIVAKRGRTLLFAEVKTRSQHSFENFNPLEAIDLKKQETILKCAQLFMRRNSLRLRKHRIRRVTYAALAIKHKRGFFERSVVKLHDLNTSTDCLIHGIF